MVIFDDNTRLYRRERGVDAEKKAMREERNTWRWRITYSLHQNSTCLNAERYGTIEKKKHVGDGKIQRHWRQSRRRKNASIT